jgi:hypothetical protein
MTGIEASEMTRSVVGYMHSQVARLTPCSEAVFTVVAVAILRAIGEAIVVVPSEAENVVPFVTRI